MAPSQPLPPDELRRRLRAGRELIGISREALGEHLADDGFGKHDVAALERDVGEETTSARSVPFTAGRKRSIARALQLPDSWFTEPDITKLFRYSETEQEEQIEGLRSTVGELHRQLREQQASKEETSALVADLAADVSALRTSLSRVHRKLELDEDEQADG